MRRFNGSATIIIACLTVGFVVFNKIITEPEDSSSNTAVPTPADSRIYLSSLQADQRSHKAQVRVDTFNNFSLWNRFKLY